MRPSPRRRTEPCADDAGSLAREPQTAPCRARGVGLLKRSESLKWFACFRCFILECTKYETRAANTAREYHRSALRPGTVLPTLCW